MPSGSDEATNVAINNLMIAHAHQSIAQPRTVILWDGPGYIYIFAAALVLFFFIYSWWLQHHTRRRGELYGPISFGALSERIGSISLFDWIVFAAITLSALALIIDHLVEGQYYVLFNI